VGIFDRLGDVIKSYLNDDDSALFGRHPRQGYSGDDDLKEAFEELDEFLSGGTGESGTGARGGFGGNPGAQGGFGGSAGGSGDQGRGNGRGWADDQGRGNGRGWADDQSRGPGRAGSGERRGGTPPETLRRDFAELGLPLGASEEACKGAYKKLLKIHHPDRHAGHEGNIKKATEKSARLNAAFDRIQKWRATGRAE
jgi:hypothetical protein